MTIELLEEDIVWHKDPTQLKNGIIFQYELEKYALT